MPAGDGEQGWGQVDALVVTWWSGTHPGLAFLPWLDESASVISLEVSFMGLKEAFQRHQFYDRAMRSEYADKIDEPLEPYVHACAWVWWSVL